MAQRSGRKLALARATDISFPKFRGVDVKNPSEFVRIAICALLVSFGRLIYYSLEISAHCGCGRTWH
jgi:hypothetical protein